MTLRVYLAGNVAVEHGDVLVPERRFPGRQGRLILAVLAWERDRAISVDELADIVWDGAPPAAWQTGLRALVSKLRGALDEAGDGVGIEHAFGCYQLRLPQDSWIDVEAASAAVHEAEAALRASDMEGALGSALVANAIARRPFLPGMRASGSSVAATTSGGSGSGPSKCGGGSPSRTTTRSARRPTRSSWSSSSRIAKPATSS
ncbi:MAG: hypothetical protein L0206_11925 [Actinobacteria bacterium]|nr:hypothetical protein [Actinomycetota bacterium]